MTSRLGKTKLFPAMASGILLLLSTPGISGFSFLAWFALVPLLFAVRCEPPKKSFFLGMLTGLIFFIGLLYWITIVLGHYGQLPFWITIPALFLLAAYMSLYTGLFAAGAAWLKNSFFLLWGAPILWVSLDYMRGKLLSGLPWLDLGYSQSGNLYILQSADLFGHHGITFLIIMSNCLVFTLLTRLTTKQITKTQNSRLLLFFAPPLLILAVTLLYGVLRLDVVKKATLKADHIPVTVVQGNIPQDVKWLPDFQKKTTAAYLDLSIKALAQNPSQLVIWPETALPFYPMESNLFRLVISQLVVKHKISLLAGVPHRELLGSPPSLLYFNSAFLLSPPGPNLIDSNIYRLSGRYDKQHLVPFGEYVPLRTILPLSGPLVETIGDFNSGTSVQPLTCQNARIGVFICFESIFPDIARREVESGANLLVNITNDAWFGRSTAPWQHLSMTVFRAVENRRSLARAANTGVSGFVTPMGKTQNLSPLFEPFTATAKLPLMEERTIFSRLGYHFPKVCLLLLLPLALLVCRKK